MDWKVFATVFGTVFLAELGDKTQLATVLFAAEGNVSLWTIFAGAAARARADVGDRRRERGRSWRSTSTRSICRMRPGSDSS